MNLVIRQSNYSLYHIVAIMIAIALFVAGRFGFFDILGLKRLFEVMLFLPIVAVGILVTFTSIQSLTSPFLLLPLSYFIFQFHNPDLLTLGDLFITICTLNIILNFGEKFSDLLLRYIILIATFFAILGIAEFIMLLLDPTIASHILLFYDSYSGSNVPVIDNFFQLMGLSDGTSYHLWGMPVTRLRSFTSEPSLLVGYFLVPGALALTYRRQYWLCGLICISFCICSFAGSVFAALAITLLTSVFFILKNKKIIALFPFVLLCVFFWILCNHFNALILMTGSTGHNYDFLSKTNSANMRFSYIRDFLPKVIVSPFGTSEEILQPLGLIVGSLARSGIFGLILVVIVLVKLYNLIGEILKKHDLYFLQKSGVLIVYGSLITGVIYLDNCFIQLYGFTLLLLTYNRLKLLA